MTQATHDPARGAIRRFGFRFVAVYLFLYNVQAFVGLVPFAGRLGWLMNRFWRTAVPWAGRVLLHLDRPVSLAQSGSGDKMYDWVRVWLILALSLCAAAFWACFDRARRRDGAVHEFIRVLVRYTLGLTLLGYGMGKILHQQMSAPGVFQLIETYGESSPMGLLWTFMGYSAAFSAFAGAAEALAGLLLFFRRAATLGALISVVVMINVVAMNLCFDVPVKLYSFHLLMFSIFLAAPDLRRLADVLVLHRPTMPATFARPWLSARAARLLLVAKTLFVAWILYLGPVSMILRWEGQTAAARPELYGLYNVEYFTRNGTALPPLLTDPLRWRSVAGSENGTLLVIFMDGRRQYFRMLSGTGPGKIRLESTVNGKKIGEEMVLSRPDPGHVHLKGTFSGAVLFVRLNRDEAGRLLLVNRGFHWISERPFNR